MTTSRSRPPTSTQVSTAFRRTDSAIPRMFTIATTIRKAIATGITPTSTNSARASPPKPRASVLAEVIPEAMTANATMKVTNGRLNARFTYSAAPAARGYFETSSAYEQAVSAARMKAVRNPVQIAPPVSAPTSPTRA